MIRDSDLLARLNKGVIDGCICCPLSRCDRRGVFRFAAAGVFVAAQCQKFLKELHLVGIERTGFDLLAVVLRPLCSVANYVG